MDDKRCENCAYWNGGYTVDYGFCRHMDGMELTYCNSTCENFRSVGG